MLSGAIVNGAFHGTSKMLSGGIESGMLSFFAMMGGDYGITQLLYEAAGEVSYQAVRQNYFVPRDGQFNWLPEVKDTALDGLLGKD
jgi:hypothetical protein